MEPTKEKNMEKTSIDMVAFNSTTNLVANAGFQSTITLDSKGALAEKEEPYNPFEHRQHEHATSTTGALVHLLKSSLGSGLLAMPVAFKNAGLAVGTIGTILVGIICTHCVHILVATSHDLCAVARVPSMGFAETCGAAFTHGPAPLRRYANAVRTFVDYALMSTYLGASCVYVVFIGASFKEVIDVYAPETSPSLAVYCSLCLLPLVLIAQIRNLKWLVPFSALANLFLVTTFAITLYYVFRDLPPTTDRALYSELSNFPLFVSTVIFAMEGIGVVMPLENEMASPQHFLGCPGVLNSAMGVVTGLYTIVGFVGYLKYGDTVKGSITLNLPQEEILSQCAKILMALAILFTYGLQFYVPMEIIWRRANASISPRYHNIAQISIRTFTIICSVALAAAFPDLELFISLVGAVFFSTLGLLTPAVVQTVHCWHRSLGPFKYIIIKNAILSVVSMVALVAGSYYSIAKMMEKF